MRTDIIRVRHTSMILPEYDLGDCPKLEDYLSVWNQTYFRMDPTGLHYDEEKRELRIPRGVDIDYVAKLTRRPVDMQYKHDPADKMTLKLKTEPRDDLQRKSIAFLIGEAPFANTKAASQLTLNLDTGDGKTYCTIAALSLIGQRALIITHNDNIKNQWIDSLSAMTSVDKTHIVNVIGSKMMKKLTDSPDLKSKVAVINRRTLQSYAKKEGWAAVEAWFKSMRFGVKVIDEAHLEFENVIKTDLFSNVYKTIYLTANFERSGHRENRLFAVCFKNIAKYGISTRAEKRRHIIYAPVRFTTHPSGEDRASMKKRMGFDRNSYSDYLIEQPELYDALGWMIDFFNRMDGKVLVLATKIDATVTIADKLKKRYPEKHIGIYNSKIDEDRKLMALTEADIIVSTPKSMGTGTDVKNLRAVIMLEPYTSRVTANQTSGRLRDLGGNEHTFYAEFVDYGFPDIVRMFRSRLPIFRKKCKEIIQLEAGK